MNSTQWNEEESFPARASVKVPPFLRNYAKAPNHRFEEYNEPEVAPCLDVTVQGKSWGKARDNLPMINTQSSVPRTHLSERVYVKAKGCESATDKVEKFAPTVADKPAMYMSYAQEARAPALSRFNTGMILEPMEVHPLSTVFCTGQRLEGCKQSGATKKGISATTKDYDTKDRTFPIDRSVTINGATPNATQALALNKLYSSLKRMKSRRGEASIEDLASIGKDSSFSRSFLNKIIGVRQGSSEELREHEEVYILLSGKSKPVRLQFKTDGLHLMRKNEWGVDLKSREEAALCDIDQESLALLEKFRERYRLISKSPRSLDKKLVRNSQFPWARHVVYKGRLCEERDEILKSESGKKLSIHVYLPNAGWEMKEAGSVESLMEEESAPHIAR